MLPSPPARRLVGRRIREARQHAGLSQDHLAARIGCSKAQLSLMETGRRTVSADRAGAIERALDVHDHSLVDAVHWAETPPEVRHRLRATQSRQQTIVDQLRMALDNGTPLDSLRMLIERAAPNLDEALPSLRQIPVINNIAAGALAEFTDLDYPAAVADEYVACPDVADPNAFAARVVGDSMSPDYREGEIVVFSPAAPVTDGTDCFIRLERDAETTFKRVRFEDDGDTIALIPINPNYQPRRVPRDDIAALYAAAYVLRKVAG